MTKRDPHDVLGVQASASSATIKAAWRRLARVNHPDLTGDDPAASRVATRRMAEINDAYAALVRSGDATSEDGRRPDRTPFDGEAPARRGGPPAPKPTRPVTGRLDTSATYRPRDQASSDRTGGVPLYVDWLVGTVMRDPDIAASARVVKADLDRRGVRRGRHPSSSGRTA